MKTKFRVMFQLDRETFLKNPQNIEFEPDGNYRRTVATTLDNALCKNTARWKTGGQREICGGRHFRPLPATVDGLQPDAFHRREISRRPAGSIRSSRRASEPMLGFSEHEATHS